MDGTNLINFYFNLNSLSPIFLIITTPVYLGLCGFGFLRKSIQSIGVLKKKYLIISLGIFCYTSFGTMLGIGFSGIFSMIIRFGLLLSVIFWYLGLREEPAEKEKLKVQKEVKIENGLIRLTERQSQITEEEVSISKEKKICLVCKGKVGGFSFICKGCGSLYCENCANSLINLENACWACNDPIDPTKPSKSYEKGKEGIKTKVSEENKKKYKVL
jgi:hypothetical protein